MKLLDDFLYGCASNLSLHSYIFSIANISLRLVSLLIVTIRLWWLSQQIIGFQPQLKHNNLLLHTNMQRNAAAAAVCNTASVTS